MRIPGARTALDSLAISSLLLMLCSDDTAHAGVAEPLFADGFEPYESPVFDCQREGYPCSLAEADPGAVERAVQLLQQSWDVRHTGTMEDVRSFLEGEPDVLEVSGDYSFLRFRIEGMSPVIFTDVTVVRDTQLATGALPTRGAESKGRVGTEAIVGEDSNNDGRIDQNDIKRALVMAPYEWQFAPNDESADLASRLEQLRGYNGNVTFKRNQARNDHNITLEDWLSLNIYDVVAISTHARRHCRILPDLSNRCSVWVSTGVEWDFSATQWFSFFSAIVEGQYDDEDMESRNYGRVALDLDFFRYNYGGLLDNQLLSFSACETGNSEGGELAAVIGGENFVMTGWTEVVNTGPAFTTALAFYEELGKGLNTSEAFDIVAGLGLFPVLNSRGIETSFEVFSPRNQPVRIIELPRLMYQGGEMPEGINILDLVTGTVGDQAPDSLQLTVQIDGVTPDSRPDFQVRYRVQEQDATGSHGLGSATLVDGYEYRYEVTHDVALGFPLVPGDVPIEVIVDLPEGGESRYSITASVASCYFAANVSGDTAAFFDGPAQWIVAEDGAINFTLRSRGYINGDPATAVQANFATGPSHPLMPGDYDLPSGNLNFTMPSYSAVYLAGEEGLDCPSCGGSLTIDTIVAEQSLAGSASITMPRVIPSPEDGETPTVTLDVDFVAAFGSQFQGSSPYVQCSIQYGD